MANEPKIYVFTRVYNAEKTIRRTIESVLSQTYTNFQYTIRDNGSTDDTYAICQEYAERDARIVLVRNAKNNVYETERDFEALNVERGMRYGEALGENDFSCLLDADDEYLPDFFERAITFAQKENLDIVVGGSLLIKEDTKEEDVSRIREGSEIVIYGNRFSDMFPWYQWYTRQVWGKLFRRNTLLAMPEWLLEFMDKMLGETSAAGLPYGVDTLNSLYGFEKAERIGLLSGCCHKYYVQEKSVSATFGANREKTDAVLYKAYVDFFERKCGGISEKNRLLLQNMYYMNTYDTINLIVNSTLSLDSQFKALYHIFDCEYMVDLFACENKEISENLTMLMCSVLEVALLPHTKKYESCRKIIGLVLGYMLNKHMHAATKENIQNMVQMYPELIVPYLKKDYKNVYLLLNEKINQNSISNLLLLEMQVVAIHSVRVSDEERVYFYKKVFQESEELYRKLHLESCMSTMIKSYPLLCNLTENLLMTFTETVVQVICGEYSVALECFLAEDGIEITEEDAEAYLEFAQKLSAIAENVDAYVYFRKLQISYLQERGRNEEAIKELEDLVSLLPEDKELKDLLEAEKANWTREYYSCLMMDAFWLNFNGRIEKENTVSFCCEPIENIPVASFGVGGIEVLKSMMDLRQSMIEYGKLSEERRTNLKDFVGKGCLSCVHYQKREWNGDGRIHYVNLSMYPSPCQSKCFYCDVHRQNQSVDVPEIREKYEKLFELLEYGKHTGVIASDATWQISCGEIAIHPYRERIFNLLKDEAVVFFTNCMKYDEAIAENLRSNPKSAINLSIDAGTPGTWYKVKGVNNFETVAMNLTKYFNASCRPGQISFKYIVFPEINDGEEDYQTLIEMMKILKVSHLSISRDTREKYKLSSEESGILIYAAARLLALCHKNNITADMFNYSELEREQTINVAKRILMLE